MDKLRHKEPCSMAWPDCDCIGCVYREIAQLLDVGLFSAWGEWPAKPRQRNLPIAVAAEYIPAGSIMEIDLKTGLARAADSGEVT